MRRLISFILASALLAGGLYCLISLFFFGYRFYFWMVTASSSSAFIGGYWLWEDFVSPRLNKGN